MLNKKTRFWMVMLCVAVTLLVAAASVIAVFMRGDGEFIEVTSPRGEQYRMITSGIYQYNSERMVAEGVGWDIFTLFVAVLAMLIALPFLLKGSLRGRLFSIGLLAYFFYQYFMYALAWAFGPLFILFVFIYAASIGTFLFIVSTINVKDLAACTTDQFPRRSMAILSIFMAFALTLMWAQRIMVALNGDYATAMLYGQTTMVAQALDLGLVVPMAVFTAVTILRKQPVGYLLSSIFVVKAVAMSAAITAMLISAWVVEGKLEIAPFIMFGAATLISLWLGIRMYRNIQPVLEKV